MATINGTNGNDSIDERADGGGDNGSDEIFARDGDDTIRMYRNQSVIKNGGYVLISDVVHGGGGNDTLKVDIDSGVFGVSSDPNGGYAGSYLDNNQTAWSLSFDGIENFDLTITNVAQVTLGDGDDHIDVRLATGGTYDMGAGDDEAVVRHGGLTTNLGDGNDRLVVDHAFANARTYLSVALSGDIEGGYSGAYRQSDGASPYENINFSGVENFTITSGNLEDTLVTGDGDDILSAGAGADLITAGAGTNQIDGGADTDGLGIDFSDESKGVAVDLRAAGEQQSRGAGSITGVEGFFGAVTGTRFDDTLIEGNYAFDAQFSMGKGNDVLQLSRGYDTADLGSGDDRLVLDHSYNNAWTYLSVPLSGDLQSGYSGTCHRSDGSSGFADIVFSGVENFTITTGGGGDTLVTGDGDDILSAGAGADLITAGAGTNQIDGGADLDGLGIDFSDGSKGVAVDLRAAGEQQSRGAGSITGVEGFFGAVTGTRFDDTLVEGNYSFSAQFSMGRGDDVLQLSGGYDTADLGSGNDRLVLDHSYNNAWTYLSVPLSGDLQSGYSGTYHRSDGASASADIVFSGVENFTITTGGGGDTLVTGDGDDVLNGGDGDDSITAAGGDDVITGGLGDDTLNGGGGIDTASYADATAKVTVSLADTAAQATGGAGNDTLTGFENLTGSSFDDKLTGDSAANLIDGSGGKDTLNGYSGNDTLKGGGSADVVNGDKGNDVLDGGLGNDAITGGKGDDLVTGGEGDDVMDGGDGLDAASYTESSAAVTVSLAKTTAQATGGAGNDTLTGFENLTGSSFDDKLTGNSAANVIDGSGGKDTLNGYSGNDTLKGGGSDDVLSGDKGNDVLDGGTGADELTGGKGHDTFLFNDKSGSDTIIDFSRSQDDHIQIQAGGVDDFDDLTITSDGAGGANVAYGSVIIDVIGVAPGALGEDDFVFGSSGVAPLGEPLSDAAFAQPLSDGTSAFAAVPAEAMLFSAVVDPQPLTAFLV